MVRNKEQFEKSVELAKRICGFVLLFFLLGVHIFYEKLDMWLLLLPALVMGLDINKLLKK